MLETIKNKDNYIIAYCEWCPVDKFGFHYEKGPYIYIQDFWVHDRYRGHRGYIIAKRIINLIYPKTLYAKYVYWGRKKYEKNGKSRKRIYSRQEIERHVDKLIEDWK